MVKRAIDFIQDDIGEDAIRISAQAYLLKFYEGFGFKTTSAVYLEDGIEHIEMLYKRRDRAEKVADRTLKVEDKPRIEG